MSTSKYNKEQFERYLKGEMSSKEAHAFEREVLKDPFAQEALEGLESHDSKTVLDDIKKLEVGVESNERPRFSPMQIAAVVSLLLVSSLAVWLFIDPLAKDESLAMDSEVTEESVPESKTLPEMEKVVEEDSLVEESLEEETTTRFMAGEEKEVPEKADQVILAGEVSGPDTIKSIQETELLADAVALDIDLGDEESNTQGAANFAGDEMTLAFQAGDEDEDEEGDEVKSDLALEEIASQPVRSETFFAPEKTESSTQRKQAEETVSAPRMARARSMSGVEVEKPTEARTEAEPVIGEVEFRKYLRESLVYPQSAEENNIKGNVILELTISRTGDVTNIDVKKSLGYGCDTEAIRLVREGPKWTPATINGENEEGKIRVRIRFRK